MDDLVWPQAAAVIVACAVLALIGRWAILSDMRDRNRDDHWD